MELRDGVLRAYFVYVQRAMRVFDSVSLYEQLRVNASESVMDLSVVGLAWYVLEIRSPSLHSLPIPKCSLRFKEFSRLRRRLALVDEGGPGGIETLFEFPVGEQVCVSLCVLFMRSFTILLLFIFASAARLPRPWLSLVRSSVGNMKASRCI